MKDFKIDEHLLRAFTAFAAKEFKIKMQPNEYQHSKEKIRLLLKAEIARHLFLENGYYQVINTQDNEIKRALAHF